MSANSTPAVQSTRETVRSLLDPSILPRFRALDQGQKVVVEYIWLQEGGDLKSKARVSTPQWGAGSIPSAAEVPVWEHGRATPSCEAPPQKMGSTLLELELTCNMTPCAVESSEVHLKPRAVFRDPFRGEPNLLVLCDCYEPPRDDPCTPEDLQPVATNTRHACAAAMRRARDHQPWFGIEQEYALLNASTKWPLGWPECGFPRAPQGPYFCAIGAGAAIGRDIAEAHLKACVHAGLEICGAHSEAMPAQWEFQVGPCTGVDCADQLWVARYILIRVCELFQVEVSFDPKPIPGDWDGSGCHTNFSNRATRDPGTGWAAIEEQIGRLEQRHAAHMAHYGAGNERRMTGRHETSAWDAFSWGIAHRGVSVRVSSAVAAAKCGYFEDRRPCSSADPYVVTRLMVETTLLDA